MKKMKLWSAMFAILALCVNFSACDDDMGAGDYPELVGTWVQDSTYTSGSNNVYQFKGDGTLIHRVYNGQNISSLAEETGSYKIVTQDIATSDSTTIKKDLLWMVIHSTQHYATFSFNNSWLMLSGLSSGNGMYVRVPDMK